METETIDLNQVAVESRVHDLHTTLVELASMRMMPATAGFVAAEVVELGSCLTALQMLVSHITMEANAPRLRVVK